MRNFHEGEYIINKLIIWDSKQKMRSTTIYKYILVLCVMLFSMNLVAQENLESNSIKIATGSHGGTYYSIGQWVSKISETYKPPINNMETQGSWQNLDLLASGKVDFAFVQYDALLKYKQYFQNDSIVIVSPMYEEYLHILLRDPLVMGKTIDLANKRVFMGFPKSGTIISSKLLMDISGVSRNIQQVNVGELSKLEFFLKEDSIDVIFHVGALKNKLISNLLSKTHCRLFSLDPSTTRMFMKDLRKDIVGITGIKEIIADTYNNQPFPINAIAIPVVLVTNRTTDIRTVSIVNSIVANSLDSVSYYQKDGIVHFLDKIPIQPPKEQLYQPSFWPTEQNVPWYWINMMAILLILLVGFWIANKYSDWFYRKLRIRGIMILVASLAMIFIICAAILFTIEHSVNQNFGSIAETVWSMFIYLTSGLEDRAPITTIGRFIASVLLIIGTIALAIPAGLFASSIILNAMENTMSKKQKDHYLILNWNQRVMEIIKQIHAPDVNKDNFHTIVVVSDGQNINFKELQNRFDTVRNGNVLGDVYFCPGDPCDEKSLINANAHMAESVLIMADDNIENGKDEKTIRSLMALQKIAEDNDKKIHIVVELTNLENKSIIENIKRNFPGTVDSVVAGQMRTLLLAQATIIAGLSKFYADLLHFTPDSNEVYLVDIPKKYIGKSFNDVIAAVVKNGSINPVIPVGLQRIIDGKPTITTNPMPKLKNGNDNPCFVIEEKDKMIVISYDQPKL